MPPPPLRSVEHQQLALLSTIHPLARVSVTLVEALGRTLATSVTAAHPIPLFDNSGMDGYAVHLADVASASAESPVVLELVADVAAGSAIDPALPPGTAARVMTGAPVPSAADSVVPVEHTAEFTVHAASGGWHPQRPDGTAESSTDAATAARANLTISVTTAPVAGAHIRRTGEDVRAGDTVLEAGVLLTARHLAAAAAAGAATVEVRPAPRVAVISTGSELRPPGTPLVRGQIPESNSVLVAGLVDEAGGVVVHRAAVADDEQELLATLGSVEAAGADLVVLTGGVSAGLYDVVRSVLSKFGTVEFARVAMQPGKPQAFGRLPGGTAVIGLPGNPVSVAVSFEVFARPALLSMQGRAAVHRPTVQVVAATGWPASPGRTQYMPITVGAPSRTGGAPTVRPATSGGSGSHLVGGLAAADGFAIVPADRHEVRPGDELSALLVRT
ncbi:molybdopterin molybdotransferase [Agromyces cerinus]|uniref:molybdopterin molybdotransferase MoeA n=1 Tax=Agromyces cerinus TaxID=33878 RepID=UPI00195DE67D|nr:gephyrin-like molybdotransferase Glp [Agromyces cerinus]MBM7829831.1 molybdopterin molybdotransferase [Agromyces cerinus]